MIRGSLDWMEGCGCVLHGTMVPLTLGRADCSSWKHTNSTQPKESPAEALTSLAMSLEALAAFIEMASGLKSYPFFFSSSQPALYSF